MATGLGLEKEVLLFLEMSSLSNKLPHVLFDLLIRSALPGSGVPSFFGPQANESLSTPSVEIVTLFELLTEKDLSRNVNDWARLVTIHGGEEKFEMLAPRFAASASYRIDGVSQ
jgi:hypothetical protein